MKILSRNLFGGVTAAFSVTLIALCSFFVLIDFLTRRLDEILTIGMPWHAVTGYYAAMLPAAIVGYHLGAFSVLIAVLAVMVARARRNEVTAMLAAGIPFWRQAVPAFAMAACVTLALMAMSEWVAPRTEREVRRVEAEYFSDTVLEYWGTREPVSWSNLDGGWTCHITKFNRVAMSGEEVFLLALGEDKEEHIRARRIYWDASRDAWILEDGSWAVYRAQPGFAGNSALTEQRITQVEAPLIETPAELFEPFDPPAGFATSELPAVIRAGEGRDVPVQPLRVEFHARFAGATLPLVMALLAAPLGTRVRRGGRSAAIMLAVGLALAYFVLYNLSLNMGRIGRLDPVSAAWGANLLFGVAGLVLIRRTAT